MRADEFKEYVLVLRGKSSEYKEKKAQLAEVRGESGVLERTVAVLERQEAAAGAALESLAENRGVKGYAEAQEELEKVSALKSEVDDRKGETLAEMSEMVKQLTHSISSKKTELAPVIKDLRRLRAEAQEIEAEHTEKKGQYEALARALDGNRTAVGDELETLKTDVRRNETRYHELRALIHIVDVK